jgi:hypothetical protein
VEFEILITGIGGQGIQPVANGDMVNVGPNDLTDSPQDAYPLGELQGG